MYRSAGLVFSLFVVLPCFAQDTVSYASITGTVDDVSGSVLPGAQVLARAEKTGDSFRTATDQQGRFRFTYLPLGTYLVSAHREGFTDASRSVSLSVGASAEIAFRLAVTGTRQVIDVESAASPVDTARSEMAGFVTPQEVQTLPLDGRNYLDLALLVPGVSRTNTGSTQRFAETSAVPGTGISVGSQRNLANTFVVDGLSANDDAADLAGTFYGQEVIREFQVVTSGATVEFGRALGGVVNIVTQSGSNAVHGALYDYFRNQRFDARNALAQARLPLTQSQYGATIGGPLAKNRWFYFGNFEQTRQNTAGLITITPAAVSAINQRLSQMGYRGQTISTGEYATTLNTTNIFAKLDGRLGEGDRINVRYSRYDVDSLNSRNVGGLGAASRGTGLFDHDQTAAVNNVATLSPTVINETRLQYTRSRLSAPVNDLVGPAVNISGVANFGTAGASPTARDIDLYEAVDDIAVQHGSHFFKAGGDFTYNDVNIVFPGILQGQYTFASLPAFLAGSYVNFQQAFGPAAQPQTNPNAGWYVQDQWRAKPNLNVNVGLRYDLQFLDRLVETQKRNLAPRIGVAWSPDASRKTVLRASYGLFYDRIPLRALSNALQRGGTVYQTAVLTPAQFGAPVFPNVLAAFPTGVLTSITTIDRNIKSPYSQQASLEVERQITDGATLSVGYQHLRGIHLILSQNQNVPLCSTGFNLCRPDPRFGNNSQYKSLGDSYFDGLLVSWSQRVRSWANYRLSYTYSKAIDDLGQFFFSPPQNNFNIAADRGPSDNDQRHRLVISGTLQAPASHLPWSRFRLSAIASYYSALPFNVQTGTDNNGDTNVNDRPAGLGRNTARAWNFFNLDVRLGRDFRINDKWQLEAMAESFNIFNHTNKLLPNNIFGNGPYPSSPAPGFGTPTAAGDPREIQLALRIRF